MTVGVMVGCLFGPAGTSKHLVWHWSALLRCLCAWRNLYRCAGRLYGAAPMFALHDRIPMGRGVRAGALGRPGP